MVNIKQFLHKHYNNDNTLRQSVTDASNEAIVWLKSQAFRRIYERRETTIWKDDWDICCIVDACRSDQWNDTYEKYDWLTGNYNWSVASCSPEWYAKTFDPTIMPNEQIGIVTANPFAGKPSDRVDVLDNTPLHEHSKLAYVDYVYEDHWGCNVDKGYLDVTHPSAVTDRAWKAWSKNNLDRLVVHYMQPHIPFKSNPSWFGRRGDLDYFGEPNTTSFVNRAGPYDTDHKEIWKRLRDGEVSREQVWIAYCDNLDWVLQDINRLRLAFNGRMLISSDHGNGMGEHGIWSHPPGMQIEVLRKVPWVPVDGLGHNEIESVDYTSYSTGSRPINDQLKALGYME